MKKIIYFLFLSAFTLSACSTQNLTSRTDDDLYRTVHSKSPSKNVASNPTAKPVYSSERPNVYDTSEIALDVLPEDERTERYYDPEDEYDYHYSNRIKRFYSPYYLDFYYDDFYSPIIAFNIYSNNFLYSRNRFIYYHYFNPFWFSPSFMFNSYSLWGYRYGIGSPFYGYSYFGYHRPYYNYYPNYYYSTPQRFNNNNNASYSPRNGRGSDNYTRGRDNTNPVINTNPRDGVNGRTNTVNRPVINERGDRSGDNGRIDRERTPVRRVDDNGRVDREPVRRGDDDGRIEREGVPVRRVEENPPTRRGDDNGRIERVPTPVVPPQRRDDNQRPAERPRENPRPTETRPVQNERPRENTRPVQNTRPTETRPVQNERPRENTTPRPSNDGGSNNSRPRPDFN